MINLIIKDVKNIVYDIKSLMLIVIMPIALMSILGASLQGLFQDEVSSGINNINIAIVKNYNYDNEIIKFKNIIESELFGGQDSSNLNLEDYNPEKILFDDFLGDESLSEMLNYQIVSMETGKKLLEDNEIAALVVLPKDYVYNSIMNMMSPSMIRNKTEIEVIKNPEMSFSAGIVEQIILSFYDTMNNTTAMNKVIISEVINSEMNTEMVLDMVEPITENIKTKIEISEKTVTGKKSVNSFQYYAAAIMSMFLMYSASIGAKALFEEKSNFTMQRQFVSGNHFLRMSISNFFRILMIVIIQSIIMILFSQLVLGVNWGSITMLIITVLFSSFAVAGIGMFVASMTVIFNNTKIANIFEFAFIQLMAILGGSMIPVEVLPEGLQKISAISINAHFLGMYLNGMYNQPIMYASENMTFSFIFGATFIILSILLINYTKKGRVA